MCCFYMKEKKQSSLPTPSFNQVYFLLAFWPFFGCSHTSLFMTKKAVWPQKGPLKHSAHKDGFRLVITRSPHSADIFNVCGRPHPALFPHFESGKNRDITWNIFLGKITNHDNSLPFHRADANIKFSVWDLD